VVRLMWAEPDEAVFGCTHPAMPAKWGDAVGAIPGSQWDFRLFEPSVVIINLGTNDFWWAALLMGLRWRHGMDGDATASFCRDVWLVQL
jgi:hypothetical protein